MQRCKKCSKKFEWKTIVKSVWWKSYSPIICDSCKSIHYHRFSTRLIVGLSVVIPMIFMHYLANILGGYIYLIDILWFILLIGLAPIYARYYIKNEK